MSDDVPDQTLRDELAEIEKFLASPEFQVAKKVTDQDIQVCVDFILDYDITNEADMWKVLEARAEARAHRKFSSRFYDRRDEIKQHLDKTAKPLDD